MKFLLFAFFATLLASVTGFAQYKLEYKTGSVTPLQYKSHSTLRTTQTMMGHEAKVTATSDESISMKAKKSGDDLVYDMEVDSSDNIVIMPSGDTTHTPSPVIGKVREVKIHPDGEEISSAWLDTTFAGSQAGQLREFTSFFFKLPGKEVSAGATWSQKKADTVSTGAAAGEIIVNTNTDYVLVDQESVDGLPCAKINFKGNVKLDGSTEAQGINVNINGTGSISGSAMFDYTNGRIISISGSSEQNLTMTSSEQGGMSIPMTQATTYDLTLVK